MNLSSCPLCNLASSVEPIVTGGQENANALSASKLLGFISLGPKRSEEAYTGSDVRLLKSVAVQTGLALENADLMRKISDEVAQRERLTAKLRLPARYRSDCSRKSYPQSAGWTTRPSAGRPSRWVATTTTFWLYPRAISA